jgi:hypothetical protein
LADATVKLGAEYGLKISGKPLAWVQFIAALGEVYGTRISGVMFADEQPKEAPASATPLPSNNFAASQMVQ